MLKLRSRNRRGFTLVELLVAIAMHNYDDKWGVSDRGQRCPRGRKCAVRR